MVEERGLVWVKTRRVWKGGRKRRLLGVFSAPLFPNPHAWPL